MNNQLCGHLTNKQMAERTIDQTDICRMVNWLNGKFAKQTLYQTDNWPGRHLAVGQ